VEIWIVAAVALASLLLMLPRVLAARGAPVDVVREFLAAGATVVDVRTPAEFRTGAYPGAVNIPLDALPQRVGELPKHRPVVLYCASGMRSATAANLLRRAGFAEVVNAGGLRNMPR
jgi:phage shock protein E